MPKAGVDAGSLDVAGRGWDVSGQTSCRSVDNLLTSKLGFQRLWKKYKMRRERLFLWLLWGEVEVLVIEAEVGQGGDGNHREVIDMAGWI